MKYLKLLVAAVVAFTLFQGCTKEYITEGCQVYTKDYNVHPNDWQKNEGSELPGSDNYFYASFNNPYITKEVIAHGTVQAYIYAIYDAGNHLGAWNPLPFVYPVQIITTEGDKVIVAENTRFEYEEGKVTFVLQDLDGYDAEAITNSMSIRVCVTI